MRRLRTGGSRSFAARARRLRLSVPPSAVFGAALVSLAAGALLVSLAFDGKPTAQILGGYLPVNAGARDALDLSAHNSPTVVQNAADPAELAIANRIDSPRYSCALHLSSDGGSTWSQLPIPAPQGEEPKCYAPDVAFGADGVLYLSFVTLKGRGNVPNAVWLSRLEEGDRALSTPRKVLGPLSFQVRLVADPVARGRIYLTWLQASDVALFRFTETGNPLRVTRSDDGGRTWRSPVRVSDPRRARVVAPSPAIGPGGELYVAYLDLGQDRLDYEGLHRGRGGSPFAGRWQLVLARSRDGGTSWAESVVERRLVPTERFIAFIPPFPSVAVDAGSGRLYAGFQDGREGDADVMVWSLPQGESRWKGPIRVNDNRTGDGTSQYLPKLAVAPDGRVDVLYYDRRSDRRNVTTEVSLQSSFDGGESFGPRLRVSDRGFDSRVGFGSERGIPDLGSRLGLLSTDSNALAVWTDTRAGTRASRKQDLARAILGFAEPARLPRAVRYALRVAALGLGVAGIALLVAAVRRRPLRATSARR
jgi:hypothetical protein